MQQGKTISIQDTTSNSAPLGLMAFGMTTVLLNVHNAGFIPLDTMILAMGIFYGAFWLTLLALIIMPKMNVGVAAPAPTDMGVFLIMWGVFTAFMFIATLKLNRALQVVFASLTVLFFLLAAAELTGNKAIAQFAGYEGIFCGLSAIYAAMAQVWNETFGREVLPLGA